METFKTYGKIKFDPIEMTDKQRRQSSWKKIALIEIDKGDLSRYYAWFLKKRFNLTLTKPLRGSHVTIINDSHKDMGEGLKNWEKVKKEWDGKEVEIILDVLPKTDNTTWWINIPQNERQSIHYIRSLVGLGRPFFGLHMTIGDAVNFKQPHDGTNVQRAKEMNLEHSKYIHNLYKKGIL